MSGLPPTLLAIYRRLRDESGDEDLRAMRILVLKAAGVRPVEIRDQLAIGPGEYRRVDARLRAAAQKEGLDERE